ncbi:tail fiber domain-containing protein [Cryobacterium tagatosivorans]|uniref:Tail fiber domain-containing protein n=1 Tax=Cryobacterium tagatosivorans TaxID=1259199 RepID=A0A4R8U9Y8_9MICO|nr:tail fiber domain-containing protein [Cryobacterium tagatosivorans]TFB46509.1 tail fiber domain-containing protein [Cryobacterium tagatosivorans]
MSFQPGSIGSRMPASEDTQLRKMRDLERFVTELGPSIAKSFQTTVDALTTQQEQLAGLLNDLQAQVDSAMSTAVNTGNVTATGFGHFGTDVTVGGDLTVDGALRVPSVPVTVLTSNYFATYATTDDGRIGHVPSSARFKQDIRPTVFDPHSILDAEIVDFRYTAETDLHGDNAPYIIGGIAEQFHAAGLGAFVNYDSEGAPFGIAYERLAVGIIPLLQQINRRVTALEAGPTA